MQQPELIPNLFRTEFSKITAVLVKLLGIENIDTAEDIASETFLTALESWPYKGIPPNPVAWLYSVAKNKAKNRITRDYIFIDKVAPEVKSRYDGSYSIEIDLSTQNIADSQLQMLFAICTPVIPPEAQIGLALRILCGLGIEEIANAFLTNKETINKRLFRAKDKLRAEKIIVGFPPEAEIDARLNTVLATLYLLFNEGYYSESQDSILRRDLCLEAIRLTQMLINNPQTNKPQVNALLALMYFQTSRFEARKNESGEIVLYADQDERLWDHQMIAKGAWYLKQAATGNQLSKYHLEASIAYWHTIKADTPEKWENILHLFNQLLALEYSPIAALNRTYALAKVKGNTAAIAEAEKLGLTDNRFYYVLLGELYKTIDPIKAREHFEKALELAKTEGDRVVIGRKIEGLGGVVL
ncbi:RNA polymerase sigma factor [Mucilaginibacter agri]|uniref:RNA polymerase subunit sigma n=1 Tax=Mucilaginibacter agri TaxID=2695265 RepID=A0A965ZFJ2_9SPHI|nr:DUF6596 domain-containing protein [Mucilaginibacter agri]NCD69177.1 RNA polymerase subunit sigma [Mucilaginibacter agri]